LVFGDLGDPDSRISKLADKKNAKAWKAEEGTNPSVLYVSHEPWMEAKANTGVQLDPKDEDVTYEQNNLKK
jgi:phosphohistidine phosphatase SixA